MTSEAARILIVGDAGQAGPVLLTRRELRPAWALTAAEADSALEHLHPRVCVVRQSLAGPVLAAARGHQLQLDVVVLLDQKNWSSWKDYFGSGATALVAATATERIFDAIADATGLSFSKAERIRWLPCELSPDPVERLASQLREPDDDAPHWLSQIAETISGEDRAAALSAETGPRRARRTELRTSLLRAQCGPDSGSRQPAWGA